VLHTWGQALLHHPICIAWFPVGASAFAVASGAAKSGVSAVPNSCWDGHCQMLAVDRRCLPPVRSSCQPLAIFTASSPCQLSVSQNWRDVSLGAVGHLRSFAKKSFLNQRECDSIRIVHCDDAESRLTAGGSATELSDRNGTLEADGNLSEQTAARAIRRCRFGHPVLRIGADGLIDIVWIDFFHYRPRAGGQPPFDSIYSLRWEVAVPRYRSP
jgi:hypothetical protein